MIHFEPNFFLTSDIFRFIKDLDDGHFIQMSLESVFLDEDGKQLLVIFIILSFISLVGEGGGFVALFEMVRLGLSEKTNLTFQFKHQLGQGLSARGFGWLAPRQRHR